MAPSSFSRFRETRSPPTEEVLADDGRDLSDLTHPDYDPATDPELRKSTYPVHHVQRGRDGQRRRARRLNSDSSKVALCVGVALSYGGACMVAARLTGALAARARRQGEPM